LLVLYSQKKIAIPFPLTFHSDAKHWQDLSPILLKDITLKRFRLANIQSWDKSQRCEKEKPNPKMDDDDDDVTAERTPKMGRGLMH